MTKPVVIVSGASRGIGRAIALRMQTKGYYVVGLYRSNDDAAKVLLDHGVEMKKTDVSSELEVSKLIDYVSAKYGRIDIIVNNAAIDIPGLIKDYSTNDWQKMVSTDLTSVFLMSKYAIPQLIKGNDACIVNISTRLGLNDFAEAEFVVYGALKAAVNLFTVGLAKELASSNVRVNAVIPTPTKTDLFDEVFTQEEEKALKNNGKLGIPEDVADLVLGVINDKSLNGQLIFDKRVSL